MNDAPRRRLLDRLGSTPSLVAQHTQLTGDIRTRGALLVDGSVNGNGHIGGEVAISASASWTGDVQADRGVISGSVDGNVVIADKLEVGATARIRGSVTAKRIAIALGAQIEGEVNCTGSDPVIKFVEKRAGAPAP